MDIERNFVSALVRGKAVVEALNSGVNKELFSSEALDIWNWAIEHYREFGESPGEDALTRKFPGYPLKDTTEDIEYWSSELKSKYIYNVVADTGAKAARAIRENNAEEALKFYRKAARIVDDNVASTRDLDWTSTGRDRFEEYLEAKETEGIRGIHTPWPSLDEITEGWQAQDFVIIAAPSGTGKTWMLTLSAGKMYEDGLKPLIFTKEMSAEQMARRVDAYMAKLPYEGLRHGELGTMEEERWKELIEEAEQEWPPLFIVGEESGGVSHIESKIERYRPDAVFIDGFYLMEDDAESESNWTRIQSISQDLKKLAKRRKIPIIVTTQKNKDGTLSFFKGIRNDADIIIGMKQSTEDRAARIMNFHLDKHREGPPKKFQTHWMLDTMEFTEIDAPPTMEEIAEDARRQAENDEDTVDF